MCAKSHAGSRHESWPKPLDNVIFELGLFVGRLGRARAILMEPREEKVKLPSDLAGVTTIPYLTTVQTISDEELLEDLSCQIWRNAEILRLKFNRTRDAFRLAIAALAPTAVLLAAATLRAGKFVLSGD